MAANDGFYISSFDKALQAVHTKHDFDGHEGDDIMNGLDKPEKNSLKDIAYLLSHDIGARTAKAAATENTAVGCRGSRSSSPR